MTCRSTEIISTEYSPPATAFAAAPSRAGSASCRITSGMITSGDRSSRLCWSTAHDGHEDTGAADQRPPGPLLLRGVQRPMLRARVPGPTAVLLRPTAHRPGPDGSARLDESQIGACALPSWVGGRVRAHRAM